MTRKTFFKDTLVLFFLNTVIYGYCAQEKIKCKKEGSYDVYYIKDTEVYRIQTTLFREVIRSSVISIAPNAVMEAKEYEIFSQDETATDEDKKYITKICKHLTLAVTSAMQDNYYR